MTITKKTSTKAPVVKKKPVLKPHKKAINFYMRATHDEIMAEHPDWEIGDVCREVAKRWRALGDDAKRPFHELAAAKIAPKKSRKPPPLPKKRPRYEDDEDDEDYVDSEDDEEDDEEEKSEEEESEEEVPVRVRIIASPPRHRRYACVTLLAPAS